MNFGRDNESTGHSSICECGDCIRAENESYVDDTKLERQVDFIKSLMDAGVSLR